MIISVCAYITNMTSHKSRQASLEHHLASYMYVQGPLLIKITPLSNNTFE